MVANSRVFCYETPPINDVAAFSFRFALAANVVRLHVPVRLSSCVYTAERHV